MKLNRSYKIAWVALLAAQNLWAAAPTNNAAAPADYSTFTKFIAQRNIFDPNRLPVVGSVIRPPRTFVPTPLVRQADAFSLVGIVGYGEGKLAGIYAFFDGANPQYRKTVQLNGTIATFKVADIAADAVTLMMDTNQTVLRIGDQLVNDGSGHWASANANGVRYGNFNGRNGGRNGFGGQGGGRRRNNSLGGFNNGGNNGNFNRVRNNSGASGFDNSQPQDPNMFFQNGNTVPDDNAPPDDNGAPGAGALDNAANPETEQPAAQPAADSTDPATTLKLLQQRRAQELQQIGH